MTVACMHPGELMVKCPNCEKEVDMHDRRKSWAYGVFKVDAYSCDCGANFREYSYLRLTESPTSKSPPNIERRSFKLMLRRGKWVKA